jgi:cell division protein FtsB
MFARLSRLILFIIMLFLAIDVIRTGLDYSGKRAKIEAEKQEIERLKKRQESLSKTLQKVQGAEFVEEEARNKLNMCLPGEKVVIGE